MSNNLGRRDFISSFSFDKRLALYDIAGSVAHVKMLVKCRIISSADGKKIIKGLESIASDLKKGKSLPPSEDIHYAVEKELIKRIGESGGKMHTARSRNDQVSTDLRLYLKSEIKSIRELFCGVQKSLLQLAQKNIDAVIPGYTHLKQAQPILFSHHILAYACMFQRDKQRFMNCLGLLDESPLGAAALAGTSYNIDRIYSAKLLGFSDVMRNSIDAVSDRDFIAEFLAAASISAMHLSRLSEDFIIWASDEFNLIQIPEDFTSGSSIMPQKKNPDYFELARGKTGRIYGGLISILTILKGLPLSYNRDLQEDKVALFDAVDTLKEVLEVTSAMLSKITINKERLKTIFANDYLAATELADYLTKKGMPFRTSHSVVKKLVGDAIKAGKNLSEIHTSQLKKYSAKFDSDVKEIFNFKKIADSKRSLGGTAQSEVRRQIKYLKKKINNQ